MLIIVEHPLCACELTVVRDCRTDGPTFRAAMHRVGLHVCLEATRHLRVRAVPVVTPLEETSGYVLEHRVVAVPILRAGLMFLEPMMQILPRVEVGFIGLRRDEETLQPHEYYRKLPPLDVTTSIIVLDPMLATGGSSVAALERLRAAGVQDITVACAIAAPEGVERVEAVLPNVRIVAGGLDRCLNERGFILPGLGDAGDRAFGTENQL
ncbi:MAG: uracil phosphoribosyltransferase [Chlorobi bacterium]|nr:uracil phosphoribosyltransferase [Chlorobiota bacterium]